MFLRRTSRGLFALALSISALRPVAARADGEPANPVEEVAEHETTEVARAREPLRAAPLPANSGVLEGRVLWSDPVPEAAEVSRNAEPYCARLGTQLDQSLSVSAGGLSDALIRVRSTKPISRPKTLPLAHLQLASCAFAPRVIGLSEGQHLLIENADPILHSVRLTRERSVVYRRSLQHGEPSPELSFAAPGIYRIGCDVHPWEVAWVVVSSATDAPVFAVTDAQGHFRIEGVPAGSWQVDAWHEQATLDTPAVRVRSGVVSKTTLHARPTTALAHEDARTRPAP